MTDEGYDQFEQFVCDPDRGLWPRWKTSHAELDSIFNRCRRTAPRLSLTEILNVVSEHKDDNPATPKWGAVYAELRKRGGEAAGVSDAWHEMLGRYRRLRRKTGLVDMSDTDIWEISLSDASRGIQQDPISGERYPDPDGRLAHMAWSRREAWSAQWLRWFRDEAGQQPPPYIQADMRGLAEYVADCRRDGQPAPEHIATYLVRIGQAGLLGDQAATPQGAATQDAVRAIAPLELV